MNEKKNFLAKRLYNIKDGMGQNSSYKFYAIYLDCNDILFTQLDKPKFIYFIYEGECYGLGRHGHHIDCLGYIDDFL
jgi:hypothetical protein